MAVRYWPFCWWPWAWWCRMKTVEGWCICWARCCAGFKWYIWPAGLSRMRQGRQGNAEMLIDVKSLSDSVGWEYYCPTVLEYSNMVRDKTLPVVWRISTSDMCGHVTTLVRKVSLLKWTTPCMCATGLNISLAFCFMEVDRIQATSTVLEAKELQQGYQGEVFPQLVPTCFKSSHPRDRPEKTCGNCFGFCLGTFFFNTDLYMFHPTKDDWPICLGLVGTHVDTKQPCVF